MDNDTSGSNILKYSPNGDLQWTRKIAGFGGDLNYSWSRLSADSLDNFYLAGYTNNQILVKFNPSGYSIMVDTVVGPYYGAGPSSMQINKNRLLITGEFKSKIFFDDDSLVSMSNLYSNAFIAEYDLAGNLKFLKKVDGKKGCSAGLVSVNKSIYLSGYANDSTYFDTIIINHDQYSYTKTYFLSRLQSEVIHPINYPETFEIYPNPTQGSLTINFNPDNKNVSIEIYDIQGKLIMNTDLTNYSNNINISSLSKGLYIVKLKTDSNTICRKIIKL